MNTLLNLLIDLEGQAAEARAQMSTSSSSHNLSLWAGRPRDGQAEGVKALNARIGQLNLVVAAVVRSLVMQGLLKPAELAEAMKEIDLEDGKADGQLGDKVLDTPEHCPKCQAKVAPGRPFCVFCGLRFDGLPQPSAARVNRSESSNDHASGGFDSM
jgi:hypothetical protein